MKRTGWKSIGPDCLGCAYYDQGFLVTTTITGIEYRQQQTRQQIEELKRFREINARKELKELVGMEQK